MAKKKGDGTYDVVVRCRNCGQREVWEMMRGELVSEIVGREECPGCGCVRTETGWEVMSEVMV